MVDLGCGHGELLTLLGEHGVAAYGVETEPDFVARLAELGLEVVEADGLAHLEGLEPGRWTAWWPATSSSTSRRP